MHSADHEDQESNAVQTPPYDHDNCRIKWDITILALRGRSRHPRNHHAAMVKYTMATLQAMVDTKPTRPTEKIHKHPTFINLWKLQLQLVYGLRKLGNVKFLLESHAGYIWSKYAFTLFSSKEWKDPKEVGEYYEIPATAITETEQRTKENKWKFKE